MTAVPVAIFPVSAKRTHFFSAGHRVHGHESKCALLHGHEYAVHFECEADKLDSVGRVIDFSVMKSKLCVWLDENYDHHFIAWDVDPVMRGLERCCDNLYEAHDTLVRSIKWVPYNPTAENIAIHLLTVVGPAQLLDTGVRLVSVTVEETRKCSATARLA